MLLRGYTEAATSEERPVRQQLKALLEAAVAQQAESSTSRQRSERGRAGAPSAHGPNPPPSQRREHGEAGRAAASAVKSRLGPIGMHETPSRLANMPRASTTTATTAHATTMIKDAGGATTATTTTTAAARRTRGVRGPLARAFEMRDFPRVFALRPTYLGTTGTPTPAYGSSTTDSPAMLGER
jgi:hypothetical protein